MTSFDASGAGGIGGPRPAGAPGQPADATTPGTSKEFRLDEGQSALSPGQPGATGQPPSMQPGGTQSIVSALRTELSAGADPRSALKTVVSGVVREQMGISATPQMVETITHRFETDPRLRELFDRALAEAQKSMPDDAG